MTGHWARNAYGSECLALELLCAISLRSFFLFPRPWRLLAMLLCSLVTRPRIDLCASSFSRLCIRRPAWVIVNIALVPSLLAQSFSLLSRQGVTASLWPRRRLLPFVVLVTLLVAPLMA